MTQRNPAYDILRVVAILLVSTQHAWSMLGMDQPEWGWLCHVYRALVDCGVPLFVAISGALLLSEEPLPLGEFFKKRFRRVLVPFFIWATAVYGVALVAGQYAHIHSWQEALLSYVPMLLENQINTSHWFVWMILALYLLTPVLQRMLQAKDSRRMVEYLLALIGLVLLLEWLVPGIYILRYSSALLIYLGVYLGGYYIARYLRAYSRWFLPLALLSIALSLVPGAPVYLLTKLTAIFLFGALLPLERCSLESKGTKIAVALSRYSYMIYLIHIPLIRAFLTVLHPAAAAWTPLCLAALAVVLSAVACLIADKILPRPWSRTFGIA